nr:hypothetical protein [uncultured Ottowia sp.]
MTVISATFPCFRAVENGFIEMTIPESADLDHPCKPADSRTRAISRLSFFLPAPVFHGLPPVYQASSRDLAVLLSRRAGFALTRIAAR